VNNDEPPQERRQGLEGLPVNSNEVWIFHGARAASRMSGWVQLLLWWPATFALAVISIRGTSIVLGACAVLMFVFAVKWTVTRWRDNRFEREMEEHAGK